MKVWKEKWQEWSIFALFLFLLGITACLHEPWYDEVQAWLIARDASFMDLLFAIPHYEGHPPLWHLILAIFAKSGMPIEIGLRIPGVLFAGATMWCILFRSPFPKTVRFLLPFTYYAFYRYSVVVRPYCITMLAFCLVAMAYKERNKHPYRFTAALMLLCASNAYGMMFAAGICIVWVWEILECKPWKKENNLPLHSCIAMGILLVCNVGQLLLIIPNSDTNSVSSFPISTILYGLVYMCVIGPADSMFLDVGMDARLQDYAQGIVIGGTTSYVNLILGAITVVILVIMARRVRKTRLLMVPYLFFALFSAGVYFWYHHIGLIFFFLLFVFWCGLSDTSVMERREYPKLWRNLQEKRPKTAKGIGIMMLALCLGMSIAWNVFAVGTDWVRDTWYTKELAEGIREVGADQNNCGIQWDIRLTGTIENREDYLDASKYLHNYSITCFFDCLGYFDENIFYNHNEGIRDISYNRQILATGDENERIREELATYGYPEFFVGNTFILYSLPIEEEMPQYYPVYRFQVYKPDKFIIDYSDRFIYAREDIYLEKTDWPIREQMKVQ